MDFGGLVVLGILWMLFNLLGMGKKGARPKPRTLPPRPTGGGDPSQQEGSRLEQLLRELERNLEGVAGTQPPAGGGRVIVPQRTAPQLPSADDGEEEDVEDRRSLEEPARVVSLEHEVDRPRRAVYDHDSEAAALARRRVEAARSRDRALSKADHKAFDARIRQEVADHTAVSRYTPEQLRNAVIWREILGPPVSERDP